MIRGKLTALAKLAESATPYPPDATLFGCPVYKRGYVPPEGILVGDPEELERARAGRAFNPRKLAVLKGVRS